MTVGICCFCCCLNLNVENGDDHDNNYNDDGDEISDDHEDNHNDDSNENCDANVDGCRRIWHLESWKKSPKMAFRFPSCTSSGAISSTATPLASRKFRQAWAVDSQLGVMWG